MKDMLVNHLTYTFEKEAWQPSLSEAIEGLAAQQAAWKPAAGRHSIWQIVRHVVLWKQSVLDAIDGRAADFNTLEAADWQDAAGDDAAWQADVGRLRSISMEIKRRVEGLDEADVAAAMATYAGRRERPLGLWVMLAATHDAYHAGQIRYLRALQGV
jgi:uncharacterized damage-inducible protein DinB